jgi:hypothetical protein
VIRVDSSCQRLYFDPANVLDVVEPVDVPPTFPPTGRWPVGWEYGVAACVRIGTAGGVAEVFIREEEWPAVRLALGLDKAVAVNDALSRQPAHGAGDTGTH